MSGTEQRLESLPDFLTAPATAVVLAALPGSLATRRHRSVLHCDTQS
jgi:hypothetical protein